METNAKTITIETEINAPVEKVWNYFSNPKHIVKWNNASDDWYTPRAENDLRAGGNFLYRMEAKDRSFGFDFGGTYDSVEMNKYIEYTIGDGRKVKISFDAADNNKTHVTEDFEAENSHSLEMQKSGWQNILDNFKKYIEAN